MRSLLIVFLLMFISLLAPCQQTDNGDSVKNNRFYIAGVTDSRTNKSIDKLPVNSKIDSLVPLENAILFLINHEMQADTNLIPVSIDIRKFEIVEKPYRSFANREFKLLFSYRLQRDSQQIDFAYFSFKEDIYRYVNGPVHYAALFRKELPEMIRQLNDYINNTKNSYPYKGIAINATMPAKPNVADTIYYNNLEKLKWDDFKAKPQKHAVASAVTSSAFNYFSQSNIKDGYLTVNVTLQCYFLTRKSWTRFNIKSEEVLDHEQLHFDITYYWALRLVAAINSHQFPATGWQYELEKLKAVFFEDMVTMQLNYDHESDNGRNSGKQFDWRKRVNELLSKSPL